MKILHFNENQTNIYSGHSIGIGFEKFYSDYEISGIQITAKYVKEICIKYLGQSGGKNGRWRLYSGNPQIIDGVLYRYFITFSNESDLTLILLRL